jgi:hypothetical protein
MTGKSIPGIVTYGWILPDPYPADRYPVSLAYLHLTSKLNCMARSAAVAPIVPRGTLSIHSAVPKCWLREAIWLYPKWQIGRGGSLTVFKMSYLPFPDRLCGLVVRVLGYRSGCPGSIPGTTRKKMYWVWNGVHSASWVHTEELLDSKVAAPV